MIRKFLVSFAALCAVALSVSASADATTTGGLGWLLEPAKLETVSGGTLSISPLCEDDISVIAETGAWNETAMKNQLKRIENFRAPREPGSDKPEPTGWIAWTVRLDGRVLGAVSFGRMPIRKPSGEDLYGETYPDIYNFVQRLNVPLGYGCGHFDILLSEEVAANADIINGLYPWATKKAETLAELENPLPLGAGKALCNFNFTKSPLVAKAAYKNGYQVFSHPAFKGFFDTDTVKYEGAAFVMICDFSAKREKGYMHSSVEDLTTTTEKKAILPIGDLAEFMPVVFSEEASTATG